MAIEGSEIESPRRDGVWLHGRATNRAALPSWCPKKLRFITACFASCGLMFSAHVIGELGCFAAPWAGDFVGARRS